MNKRNTILNTLSDKAFFRVNKAIVHKVGHVPAILLADLISKYNYFTERGLINEDDGFFNTSQMIEADTCITAKQRRLCQKKLEDAGLLITVKKGLPSKNYYFIQWENVFSCIENFTPVKYDTCTSDQREHKKSPKVTTSDIPKVTTLDDQRYTLIRNKNKKQESETNNNNIEAKPPSKNPKPKKIPDTNHHRLVDWFYEGYKNLNNNEKPTVTGKELNHVKLILKHADNDMDLIRLKCQALFDKLKRGEFVKGGGFQPSTLYNNWNTLGIPRPRKEIPLTVAEILEAKNEKNT